MSGVEKVVSEIGWIPIGSTEDANKINRAIDMLRAQAARITQLESQLAAYRRIEGEEEALHERIDKDEERAREYPETDDGE